MSMDEFFHPTKSYEPPMQATRIEVKGCARTFSGWIKIDEEYVKVVRAINDNELLIKRFVKEGGRG